MRSNPVRRWVWMSWMAGLAGGGVLGVPAHGATTWGPVDPILSVLHDTSNFDYAYTHYQADFSTDSDVYITSVSLVGGAGWQAGILEVPSAFSNNNGPDYTPGTLLPSGTSLRFTNLAEHTGPVDSGIPEGIYDFSLEVFGGATPSSNDPMATLNYQVEVYDSLNVTGSATATPAILTAGQTTTVSMTVSNHSARDFHTTTWWYGNGGMEDGLGHALSNGQFVGDWFNKVIAPGEDLTGDHTTWDATASTPAGLYIGDLGVSGGLYDGDGFDVRGTPQVLVVPEPTLLGVPLLAGLLLRRRRG